MHGAVVLPHHAQTKEKPSKTLENTGKILCSVSFHKPNVKEGAYEQNTMKEKEDTIMGNTRDTQRNAYQITINNPLDKGYSHEKIMEKLVTKFTTLVYFCLADEVGEEKTCHTHIYMYCSSRVRFSTIKKVFPEAHIESAQGNAKSNRDYIKKSGKWESSEKAGTRVEGTFMEWGKIPVQKGKRQEYEELYQLVKDGYSKVDILEYNNDYIQNIDTIDKIRTTLLIEKYKGERKIGLEVIYISGATGTGKTRGVMDRHGDENVYRVTDYQHPFDAYDCQPVIVFDEFRSSLRISDMLNYCDIYPIQLPARYSNKFACYTSVYIISNWSLEEQYPEVQKESPETWEAFLRRIKSVHIYEEDGSIKVYDTVEQYLKRKEVFHELTKSEADTCPFQQEELPFTEEGAENEK